MSGGIIIQRNAALLVAVTNPSLYDSLSEQTKAAVDAIDTKSPASRTSDDLQMLMVALEEAVNC